VNKKKKKSPLIYVYDSALHYQFFCCYDVYLWLHAQALLFQILFFLDFQNCFNDGFNYECIYRIYDPISLWVISHYFERIETIPSEEISSIIYDPLFFCSFLLFGCVEIERKSHKNPPNFSFDQSNVTEQNKTTIIVFQMHIDMKNHKNGVMRCCLFG
jgi:hypothetical protein